MDDQADQEYLQRYLWFWVDPGSVANCDITQGLADVKESYEVCIDCVDPITGKPLPKTNGQST